MNTSNSLGQLNRKIHAGVILVNDTNELLDVGVIDLLSGLSKEFVASLPDEGFTPGIKAEALDIEFHWVSEKGSAEPARLTAGLSINPTDSFETCPTLDIIVVGAYTMAYQPSQAELDFARKAYGECHAFIAICGGINLVLSSGIVAGKTATAPRFLLPMFKQMAPNVNWVEKRWVRDDKLWTSGTLLNGMDLMGNFIKQTWATKEGNLASTSLKISGVPDRDVDYKDVPWPV